MRSHAKASSAGSTADGNAERRCTLRGTFICLLALSAFAGIGASPAGAAVAAKGVTGFFGSSGEQASRLNAPLGVAVNQTTGNVYVADSENNRIDVFGPNGNFLRAWGLDVVASGPDNVPVENFWEGSPEICVVANGDTCKAGVFYGGAGEGTGGSVRIPQGVAVDQITGDVYVSEQWGRDISQFDANGNFIRSFGRDVVESGSDNVTETSAVQTLTVTATAGKYTLSFGGKETGELAFNASAAEVQTALQGLTSIGVGNATVTETSPGVHEITFAGALANNSEPLIGAASSAGEPLSGGTASVANTTTGSNGYEICSGTNGDVCKEATFASEGTGGAFSSEAIGYLTVAPSGAPNAGNLLVADPANRRVQEFSASGQFIRAFGFDVVKAGPGDSGGGGFEVCVAANGDACQTGSVGAEDGQFADLTPTRIAEDASGNVYTVEPATNFRVQKFTLPGNVPTPQGVFDEADLEGTSTETAPGDVAVNPTTGTVSVVKGFAAGATPSCPITGAASVEEARVLELSSAGVLEGTHGTCAGIMPMSGIAVRASTGDLYATSTLGQHVYVLNTGQPVGPTAQITNLSGITAHGASINALVNPGGPELPYGLETGYKLEYKRSTDAEYSSFYSTEASAGNRTTSKALTLSLAGLQPNTDYDVRLSANKGFGSGSASQTVSFTTASSAPEVTVVSYPSVSETAVRLIGSVNPDNQEAGYHFEYVGQAAFEESGFADATKVPAEDASAGSGGAAVGAAREITGLTPGATYHYRLVASNASGQGSADGRFSTSDAGACSNAKLRSEQVSASSPNGTTGLPDCMALEMVSPPSKFNQKAENPQLSLSGDAVSFWSIGALAKTPNLGTITDTYIATRGSSGWTTHTTRPPLDVSSANVIGNPCSFSPDLSAWTQVGTEQSREFLGLRYGLRGNLDGQFSQISPRLWPINSNFFPGSNPCYGGSEDSTHFFFSVQELGYLPGDPVPPSPIDPFHDADNIYEAYLNSDGQPSVALLARDENGTAVGGTCGTAIGRTLFSGERRLRGAISPDASQVYFETRPGQDTELSSPCNKRNRLRIMRRLDTQSGPQITQVTTSECTRVSPPCDLSDGDDLYQAASQEGDKVFFTTTRQLTNSDLDSGNECTRTAGESKGCDLYMYDYSRPAGARLVQISRGDSSAPTPGNGAEVLGVPDISGDGSHVYFVATGILTTTPNSVGRVAEVGQPNLYVYERDEKFPTGHTSFISTLSQSAFDFTDWMYGPGANSASAVPLLAPGGDDISKGGDGHILVFTSGAALTPDDTDGGQRDVYRYDAEDGALQRVSVAAPGGSENGNYGAAEFSSLTGIPPSPQSASFNRWVSEDGRTIVMATEEPLDPADTDGKQNTYIWHAGTVSVIGGSEGSGYINNLGTPRPTVSRDGNEVAFVASKSLLAQDGDTTKDIYVARANGGYPVPVPEVHCTGEACQGSPSPAPSVPANASETAASTGNVSAPKGAKKAKKHHKAKHKKKHRKQKRNANGNRRAGK